MMAEEAVPRVEPPQHGNEEEEESEEFVLPENSCGACSQEFGGQDEDSSKNNV